MRTPTPYVVHPSNSAPTRGLRQATYIKRATNQPAKVQARWTPEYRAWLAKRAAR